MIPVIVKASNMKFIGLSATTKLILFLNYSVAETVPLKRRVTVGTRPDAAKRKPGIDAAMQAHSRIAFHSIWATGVEQQWLNSNDMLITEDQLLRFCESVDQRIPDSVSRHPGYISIPNLMSVVSVTM